MEEEKRTEQKIEETVKREQETKKFPITFESRDAFKKRLERAGKAEVNKLLNSLGVKNIEELKLKLSGVTTSKPVTVTTTASPSGKKKEENRNWEYEKRIKEIELQLQEERAERRLRETFLKKGIKDIDYAVYLFREQINGKNDKELEEFSEDKFIAELKEKSPYLFESHVINVKTEKIPATTGHQTTEEKIPPPSTFNAIKATPDEVKRRIAELGLKL